MTIESTVAQPVAPPPEAHKPEGNAGVGVVIIACLIIGVITLRGGGRQRHRAVPVYIAERPSSKILPGISLGFITTIIFLALGVIAVVHWR